MGSIFNFQLNSRYEIYYKNKRTEITITNKDIIDAAINANKRQAREDLLSQLRNIEEISTPLSIEFLDQGEEEKNKRTPIFILRPPSFALTNYKINPINMETQKPKTTLNALSQDENKSKKRLVRQNAFDESTSQEILLGSGLGPPQENIRGDSTSTRKISETNSNF